ncbi:META domain-containing protein [Halomonas halocynthiae]|uniref:META domain-containing protein n=1 Tax=Halomonas halocynthiae TaxID=176290 RepID=UPI00040105ED|nr:META domain-containing protein [Halomonas halocynthiae]
MKKWFNVALLVLAAAVLAACSTVDKSGSDSQVAGAGANTVLGKLPAAYRGELPCADCEGIRYHLALFDDKRYTLEMVYLGAGEQARLHKQGQWSLNDKTSTLTLEGIDDSPNKWRVISADTIEQLDMQGQPINSQMNYTLQRIEPFLSEPLENSYWKLIQLGGERVDVQVSQSEAHIVLHSEDNRVSGAAGCNRLMGGFKTSENQLELGPLATTMMACDSASMALEQRFLAALNEVASYRVLVSQLELYNANDELLARFERVDLT